MFKEKLNIIFEESVDKLNLSGPYIKIDTVINSDIHPAIKTYLSAELDYLIYKDRVKLLAASQFDYSGPVVHDLLLKVGSEVKAKKKLSVDYIKKIIRFAVSFNYYYLIKPNSTLQKFLFFEGKHKSIEEITTLLNYIYFYPHLRDSLINYFNRKRLISINGEELREIIEKIDAASLENDDRAVITSAVDSMAEFLNIGSDLSELLKLSYVESFLKDKKYKLHLNLILEKYPDRELSADCNEIKEVLSTIRVKTAEPEINEDHPSQKTIEVEDSIHNDEIFEKIAELDDEQEMKETDDLWQEITEQQTENPDDLLEAITTEEETDLSDPPNDELLEEKGSAVEVEESAIKPEPEPLPEEIESADENLIIDSTEDESIELELSGNDIDELNVDEDSSVVEFEPEEKLGSEEHYYEVPSDDADLDLEKTEDDSDEFEPENEEIVKIEDENNLSENSTVDEEIESSIIENDEETVEEEPQPQKNIEVSKLLENKQMPKIIEVVFDYDMEDFSNLLDKISECSSAEEAQTTIDKHLALLHADTSTKEAEMFKKIISEQFSD